MRYSDLSTPEFFANPYPVYAEMRAEGALLELAPGLFITGRYAVADVVLLDRRLGKGIEASVKARYGEGVIDQPLFRTIREMLIGMNPPKHTRLRSLLMKSFNSRQIEIFRQSSVDISNRLVDRLMENTKADLVEDFSFLLPAQIICTMLDVPMEDASLFMEAAERMLGALDVTPMNATQLEESNQAALDLQQYFAQLLEARRTKPGNDLVSQMMLAEHDGERMGDEEIVANVIMLFIAGHETTANMIGNALIALHRHPDQLRLAQANRELLPGVVNECLRFESSIQSTVRVALEDAEIEGTRLKCGDVIYVCVGAANRDPQRFADADRLKVDRPIKDNRMLSFGSGLHFCLGARLASMEIEAALDTLFTRLPDLRLTQLDELRWRQRSSLRGVESLQVAWS